MYGGTMTVDVRGADVDGGTRPDPVCPSPAEIRTLAVVEFGQVAPEAPAAGRTLPFPLVEAVLEEIRRTVRANDEARAVGVSQIAVTFGPEAEAVSTRSLGERLAGAVARGTVGPAPGPPVVTVDRLLGQGTPASDVTEADLWEEAARRTSLPATAPAPMLRHRSVVRCGADLVLGHRRAPSGLPQHAAGGATVLIIDVLPPTPGAPGLATLAAASAFEQQGYRTRAVALAAHDPLDTDLVGDHVDLVVLVIGTEPVRSMPTWASSTWCVPAGVVDAFVSKGTDVLAVSAGAGAGALATCFERGASILCDLDRLPREIEDRQSVHRGPSEQPAGDECRLPPRFEALVRLTSSERRVLFFLTCGHSAQEIADGLVISLTTVRSHIRSILRKLGVRSQLAAVAVANSRGFGRIRAVEPS